MGIRNLSVLIDPSDHIEQVGGMMAVEDFPDIPENEDEANARPPLPVDDPDLPPEGDAPYDDLEPFHEELSRSAESKEFLDEPNDLSGIDKEFED
jgi:hypothetical protein